MKLEKVKVSESTNEAIFLGLCANCDSRVFAGAGFADLDGPAFRAYYCPECAGELGGQK